MDANNTWGLDYVGWTDVSQTGYAIQTYRRLGRAPCQTTIPQVMTIQCNKASGITYEPYVTNALKLGFDNTSIWSERAGTYVDKAY